MFVKIGLVSSLFGGLFILSGLVGAAIESAGNVQVGEATIAISLIGLIISLAIAFWAGIIFFITEN